MNTDELLSYAIRHFGKNSISEVKDNPNLVAFSSPITKNWAERPYSGQRYKQLRKYNIYLIPCKDNFEKCSKTA